MMLLDATVVYKHSESFSGVVDPESWFHHVEVVDYKSFSNHF